MRRVLGPAAALLGTLALSGCVERFLSINSDPPGAAVYLDGEKIGSTPCEVPFVWYGTRDVILELRGYTLTRREVTLSPPWWQIIPVDFITEVLLPFTVRDRTSMSVDLEKAPVSREEVQSVLERAAELREKSLPPPEK